MPPFGAGTVFKLNRDGSGYTVLHLFTGPTSDGKNPQACLVEGDDGALYGTTDAGGIANAFADIDGTFQFLNTAASNGPTRFYRTATP